MVLCHAAPKQRMLLPLKTQGGKVEKGRCQEFRRDRTAQARGKHERLRQGASGSPPIRSPANGATVPPSWSSANSISASPAAVEPFPGHHTWTHTNSFRARRAIMWFSTWSCRWYHPGLLVHLTPTLESCLMPRKFPTDFTHMDHVVWRCPSWSTSLNVGVFVRYPLFSGTSPVLGCAPSPYLMSRTWAAPTHHLVLSSRSRSDTQQPKH
jgi:hypothetical protein